MVGESFHEYWNIRTSVITEKCAGSVFFMSYVSHLTAFLKVNGHYWQGKTWNQSHVKSHEARFKLLSFSHESYIMAFLYNNLIFPKSILIQLNKKIIQRKSWALGLTTQSVMGTHHKQGHICRHCRENRFCRGKNQIVVLKKYTCDTTITKNVTQVGQLIGGLTVMIPIWLIWLFRHCGAINSVNPIRGKTSKNSFNHWESFLCTEWALYENIAKNKLKR